MAQIAKLLNAAASGTDTAEGSSDIAAWKLKIAASWKTAAASILAVAKDLVDAEKSLKSTDRNLWEQLRKELHEEKIISDAIQRKLIFIGRKHTMLIKHAEFLPPRYNAIYQLSHLNEPTLSKLIEARKLSPDLEDRDLAKLLPASKQSAKKDGSGAAETSIPLVRIVQVKKRLPADTKTTLVRILKQLEKLDGIELRFTEDGERFSGQDAE